VEFVDGFFKVVPMVANIVPHWMNLTQRQNPIEIELIELKELVTKLASVQHSAEVNISLDQFMKHIEHALQSSDQQTRREVIRLLIERIVVTEKELIVEHIIPVGNDNNRLEPTPSVNVRF
jgi:hypothetical protein